jgi:hypothetical protein
LLVKNKKFNLTFILLSLTFVGLLFYLLAITPGFKGDLEQSLRILFKQPILLKSKPIKNNKALDYTVKIFYAVENRLFNKTDHDQLKIDIKFSELQKIKADRDKALQLRQLDKPQKVKVNLIFQGKKFPATARLKGDLPEHWGNIKQWSLRFKLKDKKTIFSMNEFSISIFSERDFPYNFVISEIFRNYNVLTPRYKTIKVNFNGNDWGLMLLEEQFSDSFYAINKIKEAPIFKMTNENDFLIKTIVDNMDRHKVENVFDIIRWQGKLETELFNRKNILKKTNIPFEQTNHTLTSIFKTLQEVSVLKDKKALLKINKHIDISSFARAAAITAVFGDRHSNKPTNSRYYLSPYDLKVRPILTDSIHSKTDEKFFIHHNIFYQNIFKTKLFQKEYFKVLYDLDQNFLDIEKKFLEACQNFGKNCSNLVELDIIEQNIKFLINQGTKIFEIEKFTNEKKVLSNTFNTRNEINLIKKKIHFRAFTNGEIVIHNLTSENLFLKNVKFLKDKNCKFNCNSKNDLIDLNIYLKPSKYTKISSKKIKIDLKSQSKNLIQINYSDENKISYSITKKIEKIHLSKKLLFNPLINKLNENMIKEGNNYIFKKGNYKIKNPIIIPEGYNLVIEPGSKLLMGEDSYIMVENGVIKFNGTIDNPININSLNQNSKWKGVYVNSELVKNYSSIEGTNISNYTYFDNSRIQLSGGINLINGHFKITNSYFDNSNAEDSLNFVNSKFLIDTVSVTNVKSDAIDIDFGKGNIINSNFENIFGDAIDLSGSDVLLKNISATNVADKAISAGEETILKIEKLNISNSRIGIASKDSSKVEGSEISISNCGLYDFAAYQKKSYFSGAHLDVGAISSCKESLVQKGSILIFNDKNINQKKFNVKKLYDGTL